MTTEGGVKLGRIPCEVPFCRRTAAKAKFEEGARIICGKHSRLADARVRRIYKLARRRARKNPNDAAAHRVWCSMWERMRRQAIERSGGV